jgi:hypothetical protein
MKEVRAEQLQIQRRPIRLPVIARHIIKLAEFGTMDRDFLGGLSAEPVLGQINQGIAEALAIGIRNRLTKVAQGDVGSVVDCCSMPRAIKPGFW